MADVKAAVMASMRQEDATLSGVVTDTPGDAGGLTRFGIASKYHPELSQTTYYTTMSTADALQVAVNTMTAQYAEPLLLARIGDQALATKLLSFDINTGRVEAVHAFQRAINSVMPGSSLDVQVDGVCGPWTIAAANRCMPQSLLNAFRLQMIDFYNSDCKRDGSQLKFLVGWIDRAMA